MSVWANTVILTPCVEIRKEYPLEIREMIVSEILQSILTTKEHPWENEDHEYEPTTTPQDILDYLNNGEGEYSGNDILYYIYKILK